MKLKLGRLTSKMSEMVEMKERTRERIKKGKPNYGLLGNWAIEEFQEEDYFKDIGV